MSIQQFIVLIAVIAASIYLLRVGWRKWRQITRRGGSCCGGSGKRTNLTINGQRHR